MDHAFIREYNGTKEKHDLFTNVILFPLLFSFVLAALILSNYEKVTEAVFSYSSFLLGFLLSLGIALTVINNFFSFLLRMQENAKAYSTKIVINRTVYLICLLLFLLFYKKSGESIILAIVVSEIVNTIVLVSSNPKFLKIKLSSIDIIILKKCIKYGLPAVPAFFLTWAFNSTDKVMIRSFSSLQELGIYAASFKIVSVVTIIQTAFSTYWLPTSFRWYEANVDNIKYYKVSKYITAILIVIAALVVILRPIITIILSPEYRDSGIISVFLIFTPVLSTISYTTVSGIDFKRKTYFHLIIAIAAFSVNFILNWFLIPVYGALGAAIATSISSVSFFWMKTLISRKLWWPFPIHYYMINIILLYTTTCIALSGFGIIYELILFVMIISYNYEAIRDLARKLMISYRRS